jgi:hypothetical protein
LACKENILDGECILEDNRSNFGEDVDREAQLPNRCNEYSEDNRYNFGEEVSAQPNFFAPWRMMGFCVF